MRVKKRLSEFILKRRQNSKEEFDYLNMFLQDDKVFGDEGTLDMIIDFFVAAVQTTNTALITSFSYFIKNPEALAKVRAEVNEFIEMRIKEEPELAKLDKFELLKTIITGETCFEFNYLS